MSGSHNLACPIPLWGRLEGGDLGHPCCSAYDTAEDLAGRTVLVGLRRTVGADICPLRAVIFDLDALADIECEGHRVAYNAAFAAHGLNFEWSVTRYRQLLALSDERQRVVAELRKRGMSTESDVLTKLLADDIYTTKTMMLDEMILDADLAPRPGLIDLVMDAFAAGVWVGVVTGGRRAGRNRWCGSWSATDSSRRS